jgi:hypothetical protein
MLEHIVHRPAIVCGSPASKLCRNRIDRAAQSGTRVFQTSYNSSGIWMHTHLGAYRSRAVSAPKRPADIGVTELQNHATRRTKQWIWAFLADTLERVELDPAAFVLPASVRIPAASRVPSPPLPTFAKESE